MPINIYGDLNKREILRTLNMKGFKIKSMYRLNLIMEKMGLICRAGNTWISTNKALKNGFCKDLSSEPYWRPNVIDYIIDFLKNENTNK